MSKAVCWPPLTTGSFKINFDGSKFKDGLASYGFVIFNHLDSLVLVGANVIPSSNSIIQAEVWGLRKIIKPAVFLGLANVEIQGDNLSVTNAISNIWKPYIITSLIVDAGFQSVSYSHYFREANQVVDWMVSKGHSVSNLTYCFPPFLNLFPLSSTGIF